MHALDEETLTMRRADGSPMSDAEVRAKMQLAYADGWRCPRMFVGADGVLRVIVSRPVRVDESGCAS